MAASIWEESNIIQSTANADNTYLAQRFVATLGQTLFTITDFSYQTATGSLDVFINGVHQYIGKDFTETSNTSFTLVTPTRAGDDVVVRGLVGGDGSTAAAESASAAAISAAAALASYLATLALMPASLPLPISYGGTGQITKTLAFNALSPLTTKGDIVTENGTNNVRLPVGAPGQILSSDPTAATGLAWIDGHGASGGTATGSVTLTSASAGVIVATPTAPGMYVTLPDATTMLKLISTFVIDNRDEYDYGIKDGSGTQLGWVRPGTTVLISLQSNSTVAGVWTLIGAEKIGVTAQFQSFTPTGSSSFMQVVAVDANRYCILFGGTTVYAVMYDSSTQTWGAILTVRSGIATNAFRSILSAANQILVISCDTTTAFEAVTITVASTTLILNSGTKATKTLASNFAAFGQLTAITASWVFSYGRTGVSGIRAISVSGTTPTVGNESALGAAVNTAATVYNTTGSVAMTLCVDATTLYAKPFGVSGSTLTAGTQATTTVTDATYKTLALETGYWAVFYLNTTTYGAVLSYTTPAAVPTATFSAVSLGTACSSAITSSLEFARVGTTKVNALYNATSTTMYSNTLTNTAGVASAGTEISQLVSGNIAADNTSLIGVTANVATYTCKTASMVFTVNLDVSGASPVFSSLRALPGVGVSLPLQSNMYGERSYTSLNCATATYRSDVLFSASWNSRNSAAAMRLIKPCNLPVTQGGGVQGVVANESWLCGLVANNTTGIMLCRVEAVA